MQMSPEKSGAAIAAGAMSSREFNRTPTNVVLAAVDLLRKDYPELFAVLPSEEEWATKLASWSRLNIPASHSGAAVSDTFVAQYFLETGLLALLENGSIKPVISTPESVEDIEKLKTSLAAYRRVLFNEQPSAQIEEPTTHASESALVPVEIDPVDECTADFHQLTSSDFRKKWMANPEARGIYEKVVASGRV